MFLFILLSGIILGIWMFLSKGTLLVSLFALLLFLFLKCSLPERDRTFILKVILIAFILRTAFAILYYFFYLNQGYPDILGPDGGSYTQHSWYISRLLLEGNPFTIPNSKEHIFSIYYRVVRYYNQQLPHMGDYQIGAFSYFVGILYAVFNYSPLMIRLINSVCSIFTGVIVYFIGKEIFNSKIGKVSMASFVFFPSIFIYSITALRDTIVIFLLVAIVWLLMKFNKNNNLLWIILVLAAAVMAKFLRAHIIYPLLMLIGATSLLSLRVGILKKTLITILAVFMILSVPSVKGKVKHFLNPDILFSTHIGYVNTQGNNYKIFPERCYYQSRLVGIGHIEVAGAFIRGIFHLLCEPLPHRINNKALFLAYPQTLLLYLLMPFVIIGLIMGFRYRARQMLPLAMYLMIFIPLMAIKEGNVGTAFRHRDMLMPFLIILGIAGLCAKLGRNNAIALK